MANITRDQVTKNLFGMVDALVESAMRSAEFDKTVVATILSCTDQVAGKYRVQYQDSRYYATTNSAEDVYKANDEVYILVPQGDFNRPKKIIGKVSANAASKKEEGSIAKFDEVGESIVNSISTGEFTLSSYKWLDKQTFTHDALYLYKHGATDNLVTVADDVFYKTITDNGCKYFNIEASFLTMIPASQRMGNYGLIVKMAYEDETGNEELATFKLDIGQMTGDPYRYSNYSVQKRMYDLPIGTFKRIEEIILFSDDFVYKIPDTNEVVQLQQKLDEIANINKQLASTSLTKEERNVLQSQLETAMTQAQELRDALYDSGYITEEQLLSDLATATDNAFVDAQRAWNAAQERYEEYMKKYSGYSAEERQTEEVKQELKKETDAFNEQEKIYNQAKEDWDLQTQIIKRGKYADIFCKNIRIVAMAEVENPYFSTYSIELKDSAGKILSDKITSTVITPELWLKGEIIGSESESAPSFYWFRQNSAVLGDNKFFCEYGGLAWECLNDFTWNEVKKENNTEAVETDPATGQVTTKPATSEKVKIWTPKSALEIKRAENGYNASQTKYKCVAVLPNGNKYSKIFYIKDMGSDAYEVLLESNKETQFFDNRGTIDLVTYIKTPESKDEAGDKFVGMETHWHKVYPSGAVVKLVKPYGEKEEVSIDSRLTNYQIRNILLNLLTEFADSNGNKRDSGLIQQGAVQECFAKENLFGSFTNENEYLKTSSNIITGEQKAVYLAFATITGREWDGKKFTFDTDFLNFIDIVNHTLGLSDTDETLLEMSWEEVQTQLRKFRDRTRLTYLADYIYHDLPSAFFSGHATYGVTIVKSHYKEEPVLNDKGEQEKDENGKLKTVAIFDYYDYIGSADIRLENTVSTSTGASLIITGGDQIFKYDNKGISPTKQHSNGQPQKTIAPLKFTVMDTHGKLVNDAKIFKGEGAEISEWTWKVPAEDTMIVLDEKLINDTNLTKLDEENRYYIISGGVKELAFSIADQYNAQYTRNKIQLTVKWGNKELNAYTTFAFLKDGSNGTNGTEYVCKILPNTTDQKGIGEWPALEVHDYASGGTNLNYHYPLNSDNTDSGAWVKAELWKNNELIVPQKGDEYEVEWSVLTNEFLSDTKTDSDGNPQILTTGRFFTYGPLWEDANGNKGPLGFWADGSKIRQYRHPSSIIQAKITYNPVSSDTDAGGDDTGTTFSGNSIATAPQSIFGVFPMTTIVYYNDNYKIRIKPDSGYNEVIYKSDGTDPEYPENKEFIVEVFYLDSNSQDPIPIHENKITSIAPLGTGAPIKCKFSAYGQTPAFEINNWSADIGTDGTPNNKCTLKFNSKNSAFETNNGLRCDVYICVTKTSDNKPTKWSEEPIGTIFFPIHVSLNRYGMSALNDWNGTSLTIGTDEQGNQSYLLAPQVGAGFKESDNSFTGMVMGTTRNTAKFDHSDRTGLFGYKAGQQTVFLDAETGKAEFGNPGTGQIIIEPVVYEDGEIKNSSAKIYGGDYKKNTSTSEEDNNGSGLLIDLTKPEISYGSGYFNVDSRGVLTATGADITGAIHADSGYIGPWIIDNYAIAKASVNDVEEVVSEVFKDYEPQIPSAPYEQADGGASDAGADESDGGADPVDDKEGVDNEAQYSDGQRRIFYTQPNPPYQQGDLWIQTDDTGGFSKGVIAECTTNPTSNIFNSLHWTQKTTYINNSQFSQAKEEIEKAYKQYIASEASITDGYIKNYLDAGGSATVTGNYVMAPIIGGGYLSIQGTRDDGITRKVLIDPLKKTNTDYIFQIHGPVPGPNNQKTSGIVMGVQDNGDAIFIGKISAVAGNFASWSIDDLAIYNLGLETSNADLIAPPGSTQNAEEGSIGTETGDSSVDSADQGDSSADIDGEQTTVEDDTATDGGDD